MMFRQTEDPSRPQSPAQGPLGTSSALGHAWFRGPPIYEIWKAGHPWTAFLMQVFSYGETVLQLSVATQQVLDAP